MKKTIPAAFAVALLSAVLPLTSCQKSSTSVSTADYSLSGTLTIVSDGPQSKGFEAVDLAFQAHYPNVKVVYEYLDDYNANLLTRLKNDAANAGVNGYASTVDLFTCTAIQSLTSSLYPYATDLYASDSFDPDANTFPGLIKNFQFKNPDASAQRQLFSIPLGAESRGMFVNKSLLKKYGINAVPTNRTELLADCAAIYQDGAGLIPFQGNPGSFAQWLMYPAVCNAVANAADYASLYADIDARKAGISELFRDPFQFLYNLVNAGYYNYDVVENNASYGLYKNGTGDTAIHNFFGYTYDSATKTWVDTYPGGKTPFMSSTLSNKYAFDQFAEENNIGIDYEFILAPVGAEGGYAYLSPANAIAINKNTTRSALATAYLKFLFTPENNKLYASKQNLISNTADATDVMNSYFHIPSSRSSDLGKVTFSWDFYSAIVGKETKIDDTHSTSTGLRGLSKLNKQKYMIDNGDGTYSVRDFQGYFMTELEKALTGQ